MLLRRYRHLSKVLEQSTFLPFLYQTRTIARTYATASPDPVDEALDTAAQYDSPQPSQPRQRAYQRPDRRGAPREFIDHVPFEGSKTNVDSDFEGSTITPGERKAFEGLFKLRKANSEDEGEEGGTNAQVRQRRESEREHDKSMKRSSHDVKGQSLDDIMESARQDETRRANATYPKALQRMAHEADSQRKRDQQPSQRHAISKAATHEKEVFNRALEKTTTDAEIWDLLQEKVFKRVAALNLDGLSTPKDLQEIEKNKKRKQERAAVPAGERKVSDRDIFTQELSRMLINAHTHLTACYPHSPLPMAILPHLRSLGPTAFALGASTHLYNLHLRCLYARYLDLDAMVATLREMDETVYSFDESSEVIVRKALAHANLAAKGGVWGEGVKEWWEGRTMAVRVRRLGWWLHRISERRQEEALRRARLAAEMEEGRDEGEEFMPVRYHSVA